MNVWGFLGGIVEAAGAAITEGVRAWNTTRAAQRVRSAPPPKDGAAAVDAQIDAERAAAKAKAAGK